MPKHTVYENVPDETKKNSRRLILLAILLYGQFIQINSCPNTQFLIAPVPGHCLLVTLSSQQRAYKSFLMLFSGLIPFPSWWYGR